MKKLITAILVLALATPALGKSKSSGVTINYGSGGTAVNTAIQELDDEFDTVYSAINELYKMQAGTSDPDDNARNDLFLNTTTTPPVLEYYDGDSFEPLQTSALSSGLTLDTAFANYSQNVFLTFSGRALSVVATATEPATIGIGGDKVYQNTSTVTINLDVGLGSAVYHVLAVQSGSTTTFTLELKATGTALAAKKRIIGELYYNTDDDIIEWVRSYETPRTDDSASMPYGVVHAYNTAATNLTADTGPALVPLNGTVYDPYGLFIDASDRITVRKAGWYHIKANLTTSSADENSLFYAIIYVSGNALAAGQDKSASGQGTWPLRADASTTIQLAAGDYIQLYYAKYGGATRTMNRVYAADNSLQVYYIGRSW